MDVLAVGTATAGELASFFFVLFFLVVFAGTAAVGLSSAITGKDIVISLLPFLTKAPALNPVSVVLGDTIVITPLIIYYIFSIIAMFRHYIYKNNGT